MNKRYRKLRLSILLQTLLVTALTVLVGGVFLVYVVDGVYNDSFANSFVSFLTRLHVSESRAIDLYWSVIGHNKILFVMVGFLVLFSLFYYVALARMTRYLGQVEDSIENILSDSAEPIRLITELSPLEERLNEIKETLSRQRSEAQEAERRKNDLVLFLAHDLKTPLTSVVAYLSMLDSYPDMPEEERKRSIGIALEKAIRLGDLIQEFFEITRFHLQDIALERTRINLTLMLEQIADELYGVLQEKHLTCQVDAEEGLVVDGDADKLARVFDNILRNAIVYCKADSTLRITALRVEAGVELIFENEGRTISPENLERIFDKFYRTDAARSSSTGGAGLGLAIAREIVELHGGRIQAESEEGRTRFIVTLPGEKGEEDNEVHTHRGRPSRGGPGRGKSIQRRPRRGAVG